MKRIKHTLRLRLKRWRMEHHKCPECGKKPMLVNVYCTECWDKIMRRVADGKA